MKTEKYWDDRANMEYEYKNEKFYTITAIPYYYKRRKIILDKINSLIHDLDRVCDFGCGDGEYIRILSKENKTCSFHGVDISAEMIEVAKNRNQNKNLTWEISGDGIHKDSLFDIIYSSAIFAHVSDELVSLLFNNIFEHIAQRKNGGGTFVLCEQTAPFKYGGETFIRRTTSEYIMLLNEAGFKNIECFIIDFWLHRLLFERKIGKKFVNYYMKKCNIDNRQNAMILLNSNKLYRLLSYICSIFSIPKIFKAKNKWGYCFIIAKK